MTALDANPEAFLTHLGTAAPVGAVASDEVVRLAARSSEPLFRSVFRLRFADEAALERRLGELIGRSGMWWLGPSARPATAGAVLERTGVARVATMSLMTADLTGMPSGPADVDVAPVRSAAALTGWVRAHAAAYGHPPHVEQAWLAVMSALGTRPDAPLQHFLATVDGEPAAAASTFAAAGVVGLYNVATVPGFRGRGAGTAVSLAALAHGRQTAHRFAMLGAEPAAAGFYHRLGFRAGATMAVHVG